MPYFCRAQRVIIRSLLAASLGIAVAAGVGGLLGWHWAEREFYGPGPSDQAVYFRVDRGDSVNKVADGLAAAGLISQPLVFRFGARWTEQSANLKFGSYEIPVQASMDEILKLITDASAASDRHVVTYLVSPIGGTTSLSERIAGTGQSIERLRFSGSNDAPVAYADLIGSGESIAYRVSVPEGLTSWQVIEALEAAEFLDGVADEVPGEGLLAPNSYAVERGQKVADIVERMLAAQERILAEEWENRSDRAPVSTPEEALILASLVEKETGVADERSLVASVFANRLSKPMRLQTDPSVIYGITGGQRPLGRGLRQSELQAETPYNTYLIDGLPPTPIANPGREAIRAALNPAETSFYFFVADGTGGHAFAETYSEHQRNVRKWRQVEANRQSQD